MTRGRNTGVLHAVRTMDARRGRGERHALDKLLALCSSRLPFAKICSGITEIVRTCTGLDAVVLERLSADNAMMELLGTNGPVPASFRGRTAKDPAAVKVARTGKVMLCSPGTPGAHRGIARSPLQPAVYVPMKLRGKPIGVLTFLARKPWTLDNAGVASLLEIARGAAEVLDAGTRQEKLRISEEIARQAFRGNVDPLFIAEAGNGVILDANTGAAALTGFSAREIMGRTLFSLHAKEEAAVHERELRRLPVRARGKKITGLHFLHKDGRAIPIEINLRRLRAGGRDLVIETVRDVSEQRRTEIKLTASEELLRLIVEGPQDMFFFVHNAQGTFTYLSPSVEKITGHSVEEWKARYTKYLTSSPVNRQAREYVERALRYGTVAPSYLCEVCHKDGRPLLLEITEKPILKEEKVIGIQGVARDITERKRLEEAILESRDHLNRILDQTPISVVVLGSEGTVQDVNEAFLRLVGARAKDEVVGWFNAFTSDLFKAEPLASRIKAAYAGEIVDLRPFLFDPRLMAEDAESGSCERTVRAKIFPVLDRNAKLVNVVAMIEDVTDVRVLEEQLVHSQKMESIGLLAGGIAHDFNNILGGILGYASYLKTVVPKGDKIHAQLDTIERSALRAADLTSQLLAFARGGKYVVKPIDLHALIDETIHLLRGTIGTDIIIDKNFSPDPPVIEADAGQIQQVLMNLCVNARDAMPGGGFLRLTTERVKEPNAFLRAQQDLRRCGYVRIGITDTGIGIDRAVIGRIFEPFFTTKEKGKGTGLGLATVYGIVKNHGGYTDVESEVGRGTTFSVYFPMAEKPAQIVPSGPGAPPGGRETIMIVDDEETIRSLVKDILESKGYRVFAAAGGKEALTLYENHGKSIDLVILDMAMPGMGGRETFERLRDLNRTVKAILSTGYSEDDRARELLSLGVKAFVQKPYKFDDLSAAVRKVLDEM